MGGIGKTTLANKVFTDPFVVYHFHVRGWVTVSQTYDKRDLLIQVLSSIDDQLKLEKETDSQLHKMLHRSLYCQRYLIVIDDIWSKEAWDKLKLFFPDHNSGSRILLTSRLTEVAAHAKSHGLVHHLKHLTEEESWELLCGKVFQGDECPEWLICKKLSWIAAFSDSDGRRFSKRTKEQRSVAKNFLQCPIVHS
ncbi:unnamed protein product [Lactuca virosa]|uniref:NB-ARC domain-containing protein n=1 Tax=Lactuca virosa TaxID=75947 RepID=A0AAU9MAI5_9ASTR|nr:unnamed protein product [Lactuca virosa]